MKHRHAAHLQYGLAIFWAASIVPTLLWLSHSLPWLLIISVWANVAGHWSSGNAAKAKAAAEEG